MIVKCVLGLEYGCTGPLLSVVLKQTTLNSRFIDLLRQLHLVPLRESLKSPSLLLLFFIFFHKVPFSFHLAMIFFHFVYGSLVFLARIIPNVAS